MNSTRTSRTVHGFAHMCCRDATSARLCATAAALLLAGCTSFIPDYQRPAAPVAPTFPFDTAGAASPKYLMGQIWESGLRYVGRVPVTSNDAVANDSFAAM